MRLVAMSVASAALACQIGIAFAQSPPALSESQLRSLMASFRDVAENGFPCSEQHMRDAARSLPAPKTAVELLTFPFEAERLAFMCVEAGAFARRHGFSDRDEFVAILLRVTKAMGAMHLERTMPLARMREQIEGDARLNAEARQRRLAELASIEQMLRDLASEADKTAVLPLAAEIDQLRRTEGAKRRPSPNRYP